MTLWGRIGRRPPPLHTREERWETPDGDQVTVVRLDAPADSPRMILLHGLEGSARSHYVGGLLDCARRQGWGADVLIFRTCDGRMNRVERCYHSGETTDLDLVVRRVTKEHPQAPLALIGVSLGGNVALKWLGEQADAVPQRLRAAVAVSVPFDLARSSRRIDRGFSRLYARRFLRSLRDKALAKIERFPDLASAKSVRAARTLWAFDDAFTSVAHGFRDAADYYARSSSIGFLPSIRVPTLLLSARDDPFHPPEVLDEVEQAALANAFLTTEFHPRGGHAGFVEGSSPHRATSYLERRVGEFCAERFGTSPD
jgi:predicted alpha/beta-fold hydrolase